MRGRMLVVLMVIGVAFVATAALLTLRGTGADSRVGPVEVDISELHPGGVIPVTVAVPGMKHTRVFVVREGQHTAPLALLGVSTHLGCRVLWPGDPSFGVGLSLSHAVEFEDPCGGSTFGVDGSCLGGPCPRGLDRYPVRVVDGTAQIDTADLTKGSPPSFA